MPPASQSRAAGDRIEALLDELAVQADRSARAKAEELVRLLMELHGSGLNRLLDIVYEESGEAADRLFARLAGDSLVSSLLLLHGLHPQDLETRVQQALDKVRPYLGSHGGDVKLLGVDNEVVRLRLEGSCDGCPSSAMTMKLAVESAIEEAAPEVRAIEVEGATAPPAGAPGASPPSVSPVSPVSNGAGTPRAVPPNGSNAAAGPLLQIGQHGLRKGQSGTDGPAALGSQPQAPAGGEQSPPPRLPPVLGSLGARAQAPAEGERCELCGVAIPGDHQHLISLESRSLLCACRPCFLLFTSRGAAGGKYRAVSERCLFTRDLVLAEEQWERLQIPVAIAFFFYNSSLGRTVAFYPGPAGATESLLPLEAWDEVVRANPLLSGLEPDVEALLLYKRAEGFESYVAPIDACYELVGRIRRLWKGFQGGEEAWQDIEAFFTDLRARSTEPARRATETATTAGEPWPS
jgi:Fe-S cluster biogenesis protein NfuA